MLARFRRCATSSGRGGQRSPVAALRGPHRRRLGHHRAAKAETVEEWWTGLDAARHTLEEALVAAGRDPASFPRYLNLDSSPQFSLTSRGVFEEMVGRAEGLGFTDVITHWPRSDGPYAGSVAVLEDVAASVLARAG